MPYHLHNCGKCCIFTLSITTKANNMNTLIATTDNLTGKTQYNTTDDSINDVIEYFTNHLKDQPRRVENTLYCTILERSVKIEVSELNK